MKPGEPAPVSPAIAVAPATRAQRFGGRSSRDVLGLAWLNGTLHAAVFRRQQVTAQWKSVGDVGTLEELASALDQSISATRFGGTDVFIVLAHEKFVHQVETTPAFSKSAVRSYLRNWIERYEKEHEPVLWVGQPAMGTRDQAAQIIHILPAQMYQDLNQILLARRLDLLRLVPVFVPLQLSLSSLTETEDLPVLVAAEVGATTAVVVGKTGGSLLFARTILASWNRDASRVAVEINRSLLYAKQQFGTAVDFVWLLGPGAESGRGEVSTKCGSSTEVITEPTAPIDWLKSVSKLSHRYPVNLISGYQRQKHQVQFVRRLALAACWLGAVLAGFSIWENQQAWEQERGMLTELRARESDLFAEHEKLSERNESAERNREFIREVETERLPPVSAKFLEYFAAVFPREGRLSELTVKWDEQLNEWTFSIDGFLEADPQTARTMISAMRRQLSESPFKVRFMDTSRRGAATPFNEEGDMLKQSFKLEGGLFAN